MTQTEEGASDASAPGAGAEAIGIALDAARSDSALTPDARTLLREQARLARLQADQIHEEAQLTRWTHRMNHASVVMKLAFELSLALVVVAITAALATAMWSAAHDNGLVIEAFSVPPDLAQRGLNGEAVANQLLDKLDRMQAETNSIRPADTFRNNWGDDIKVEIPDTGISIGELNRYLRHWLGHETHITGEIYRTLSGVAVTARASGAGNTFDGKESDLDGLLQKAAESIYGETQPYRYAAFLNEQGRDAEAIRALKKLAAESSSTERAWALSLLGNLYYFYNRPVEALDTLRAAVAADPSNAHAWDNLANNEASLDRLADAYRDTTHALRLYNEGVVAFDSDRLANVKLQDGAFVASAVGDSITAEAMDEAVVHRPDRGGSQFQAAVDEAGQIASAHEFSRARALLAAQHPATDNERINLWFQSAGVAWTSHDWPTALRLLNRQSVFALAPPSFQPVLQSIFRRIPDALFAETKAETGDIAGARRLIAATPQDCYTCLRARALIDEAAGNWNGAAFWFARTIQSADAIPTAWSEWGVMLLKKGDVGAAIAKFGAAASRGPRFADPLEGWGEALMRQNRAAEAIAKFEQANRFAPRWGRLHLKWGEALWDLGRRAEAQTQWTIAAGLDLDPVERARVTALRQGSDKP